jgi:UDP-N-acetylmuramoyl-tripeptide--D-alanyl-D-alanine ligase
MPYSIDSRQVQKGDFFIPVKGAHFDGNDFIPDVIQKGGIVLDVDLFDYAKNYRKKLQAKVIAIVGSAGKTTVKDICASILSTKYNVVKTKENQNNEYGVPLTLLSATGDTEILIVEMGMRKKGDLSFLAKIVQPDYIVFTGVGKSHIEFFKSQAHLANAKAEIFRKANPWQIKQRIAFINANSAYYKKLIKKAQDCDYKVVPYTGVDKPGENINAGYAVGNHFNCSSDDIQKGFLHYQKSSHRLHVQTKKNICIIDDSYNANPDGVIYALQFMRRFKGRKIIVLSGMLELGKFSEGEHQNLVATMINEEVSLVMTYGKEIKHIHSDVLTISHFDDRTNLHQALFSEIKSGDVVLIKGSRGYQMEKTVEALYAHLS